MQILNKSISCSFSRDIIASSLREYNISKRGCSKFCYASAAVLTSLVIAPVEAIARFALALISSIFLVGRFVGGQKGLALASIPVRLLASAELSFTSMIASFMVPYMICKNISDDESRSVFNVRGNNLSAMSGTLTLSLSCFNLYRSSVV
jgi:hypothetical protein